MNLNAGKTFYFILFFNLLFVISNNSFGKFLLKFLTSAVRVKIINNFKIPTIRLVIDISYQNKKKILNNH